MSDPVVFYEIYIEKLIFTDVHVPSIFLTHSVSDRELAIVVNFFKDKGYGQNTIDKIVHTKKKKVDKYSKEEICNAILIHSMSPKAYETLRVNNLTLMPLPHPSTLNQRIQSFVCAPGL